MIFPKIYLTLTSSKFVKKVCTAAGRCFHDSECFEAVGIDRRQTLRLQQQGCCLGEVSHRIGLPKCAHQGPSAASCALKLYLSGHLRPQKWCIGHRRLTKPFLHLLHQNQLHLVLACFNVVYLLSTSGQINNKAVFVSTLKGCQQYKDMSP